MNHYLASFGGNVDMHLFLNVDHHKWLVTLHNGMTNSGYFPGMTFKWIETEISPSFYVTASATGWLQPKDQRFDATTTDFVADAGLEFMYYAPKSREYYLGFEAKTPGGIAGNVYLDANFSTYTGVRIGMF